MPLPLSFSELELAAVTGARLEVVHQCRNRGIITPAPSGRYGRLALFVVALVWAAVPIFPPGSSMPYELVRELAPKLHPVLGDLRAMPDHVALRYEAGPLCWQIGLPVRFSREGVETGVVGHS